MRIIKVKLNRLVNFNRKRDIEKAKKVQKLIEVVINSNEFRENVISADFKDRRFRKENGTIYEIVENGSILNLIIGGNEQYDNDDTIDFEWDFQIVLYRSFTGEIGHRSKDTIFTKKKKFRKMPYKDLASHWIHEYMHVIGFTHDFKRTKRRAYSVPYLVGEIAGDIMKSNDYDFLN
ncbi:MAG: hypothetical protein AAF688_14390 [Bacteroidota bacterium]